METRGVKFHKLTTSCCIFCHAVHAFRVPAKSARAMTLDLFVYVRKYRPNFALGIIIYLFISFVPFQAQLTLQDFHIVLKVEIKMLNCVFNEKGERLQVEGFSAPQCGKEASQRSKCGKEASQQSKCGKEIWGAYRQYEARLKMIKH